MDSVRHTRDDSRCVSSTVFLLAILLVCGCAQSPEQSVVAGTTHIEGIVRLISDESVQVYGLIPPGMCPGHFDMRPSDVAHLARGGLLLVHPWQKAMPNVSEVVEAANVPKTRIKTVNVKGSWMPPCQQIAAIKGVADQLAEYMPERASSIHAKAKAMADSARDLEGELKQRLAQANAGNLKVLCNDNQAEFVTWAGFDIIETYGRSEDMGAAEMERLISMARNAGVALVVDNLQSGETKSGAALVRDIGCVHVVLTSFPGGFSGEVDWNKSVIRNVDMLLEAADEWRSRHD